MTKSKKIFLFLIILGSAIGFLNSAYIAVFENDLSAGQGCDIRGFDCGAVLSSQYSRFLGAPLSWWGAGYYLSLFFLAVMYFDLGGKRFLQLIEFWLWSGLAVSGFLIYLQAIVLKQFCFFCLISEIVMTVMFGSYLFFKLTKRLER